jgi:hypothetical protein
MRVKYYSDSYGACEGEVLHWGQMSIRQDVSTMDSPQGSVPCVIIACDNGLIRTMPLQVNGKEQDLRITPNQVSNYTPPMPPI